MEEEKPKSNKWIKYAPKWLKIEETETTEAEIQNIKEADLRDWFKKEKWVDVSRPKKDGKWQPCGRGDTSKGKKPVCTPVNKAKGLSEKERRNRVRQKRQKEKEPNPDKKPNVTKYTEQAGGKSNVSNENYNLVKTSNDLRSEDKNMIKFASSVLPISELFPKVNKPKFVKVSQNETTPIPDEIQKMLVSFNDVEKKLFDKCFELKNKDNKNLLNEEEKKDHSMLVSLGLNSKDVEDEFATSCYEFVQEKKRDNKVEDTLDLIENS